VLGRALEQGAFSAVAAEVGDIGAPFWQYAAGRLAFDSPALVDENTIFDLASLTKVLSTTTIALLLCRAGVLHVNAPVATTLPAWSPADRAALTFRDLLEHASGLPAHRDYFRRLIGMESYLSAIVNEPLEYVPRTRSIYSDLGFIVLGAALETLANASLARQFEAWKQRAGIEEPLAYRPPLDWKAQTAVTEYDEWRGRRLQGEVHDGNAAALGGVAAHAGLFGTARAVGAAARWWLRELANGDARQFAVRSSVPGSSRALGWDTMRPTSSCGTLMPGAAIGHTGFTGTSLWLDPSRNVYFVLLTNRVHAARSTDAIQVVRRDFHDEANRDLA
jgi:CubicO group peptidase (beta-lactamase class C family)